VLAQDVAIVSRLGAREAGSMGKRLAALFIAGIMMTGASLLAHHSTAMYDMANPVTVKGAVKRFEWTNPHAFIYLDVTDEKGTVVEWEVEMMSLNHLRSYGWMRTTVKAGDIISCTGGRAKSGAPSMISALIELPDGRKIRS
jgi:hypothetical protein